MVFYLEILDEPFEVFTGAVLTAATSLTFPLIVKTFVGVFELLCTVTVFWNRPTHRVSYLTLIAAVAPGAIGVLGH